MSEEIMSARGIFSSAASRERERLSADAVWCGCTVYSVFDSLLSFTIELV